MNEHTHSIGEQGVLQTGRSSRAAGLERGNAAADITQLLQGLLVAFLSVSMLLGGFLLSQLDTTSEPSSPTQRIAQRSTLTPFLPTLTPQPSATISSTEPGPTPTPEAVTAANPTPEEEEEEEEETAVPATPTVAPTQPSAPPLVCTRPPGWIIYTVRIGDTFASLAERAGVSLPVLMQANCRTTTALIPGEHIYIPAAFYASPTPEPYPCGPPWGWVVYIVQRGDTLYSLSRRYNVGVESIRRANCLDSYAIYVGQALYVPPLPPTPWPSATPTATPFPSATPTPWPSPTPWPTFTPTGTAIPTPTTPPTPVTKTPSATPSGTPTEAPTGAPTATYIPSPTPETPAPTSTPTAAFTPSPAFTPTPTATPQPTATWTPAATSTPTAAPSPTFTVAPTSTPTQPPPTSTPLPTSTPTEPLAATAAPSPTSGG